MPSDAYEIAFVQGFCESLARRVGELEALAVRDRDRRDAIEARVAKIENRELNAKLASPTDSGRIVVDANEFERLRRIEKAAQSLQDGSDDYEYLTTPRIEMAGRWRVLRGALMR